MSWKFVPSETRELAPNPDLVWYFNDSASALGFRSASPSMAPVPSAPKHPTQPQLTAARRQRAIRSALSELSSRLQAILEATYEAAPHSSQLRHDHGLASGVVARALAHWRVATEEDRAHLEKTVREAHVLVQAAHEAFEMVYDSSAPSSRREQRTARVQRWLDEQGIAA